MITKFPKENVWKQTNIGKKFGDIIASFNLDLAQVYGSVVPSPRFLVNIDNSDDAQLDVAPFAIIYNAGDSHWHVGSSDRMFIGGNLPNEAFTEDAATDAPSFETTARPDLAFFNNLTYAMAAELWRLDGGGADWDVITSLTGSTNGAPLIPFSATGRLYYRIGLRKMGSINTSETAVAPNSPNTTQYTLDLLDDQYTITCGKASSDFIWLGTDAPQGQKARVHKWNGSSTAVTATYEIDAQAVLAIAIKDNTPWLIDSNGVLRKLNGGQFMEVDRLPFKKGKAIKPVTGSQTTWLCHYNGMVADGDDIYMLLNTSYADGTIDERVPSGVWRYNELNGLHHYGSLGTTKSGGTITDYGGSRISAVGALAVAKVNDNDSNGGLLAGATIFTSATATKVAVFYNDTNQTLQSAGYFVTSKVFSSAITDIWQMVYGILGRRFLNSTDKVVIKGRNQEDEPVEATITWTSTTTATTSTNVSAYDPDTLGYQPELEVLCGVGAGKCPHITDISESGGTYTITIDEAVTGATGTAKARFQKWVKLGSYNAQTDDFVKFPINGIGTSPWLEIKCWFLSTGKNELNSLIISSKTNEAIE